MNQIFIAGNFTGKLDPLELTNPNSHNVYLTYLKDDTWLMQYNIQKAKQHIFPNPFYHQTMVQSQNIISQIIVYDLSGRIVEKYLPQAKHIEIGESWQKGIYFLQIIDEKGVVVMEKVVKD